MDTTADSPLHDPTPHVVRTALDLGQMVKRQRNGMNLRIAEVIREDVTGTIMNLELREPEVPSLPDLPDFLTSHIDPFSGENDAMTPGAQAMLSAMGAAEASAASALVANPGEGDPYAGLGLSRNAPCPCGSGEKYKHCHGAQA